MTAQARLYTEPQAAEVLQVCTRTLRKARQEGRLTYVLIGRNVRYTLDDLDAFIEGSRQQNEQPRQAVTRRTVRRQGKIVPFSARN